MTYQREQATAGPAARMLRALIWLYRMTLSALMGRTCRHLPTCSEYADEAIARHGAWVGFWMALARVSRCRPGGSDGYDPVPEMLDEHPPAWAPWRYGRWSGDHIDLTYGADSEKKR